MNEEQLKAALEDYIVTANSGKYKTTKELNAQFPEFSSFTNEQISALDDYIVTANSGKYKTSEELNAQFPEFFTLKKKDDGGSQSQPGVKSVASSPSGVPTAANAFSELESSIRGAKKAYENVEVAKKPNFGAPVMAPVTTDMETTRKKALARHQAEYDQAIKKRDQVIEQNKTLLSEPINNAISNDGWKNFVNKEGVLDTEKIRTWSDDYSKKNGGGTYVRDLLMTDLSKKVNFEIDRPQYEKFLSEEIGKTGINLDKKSKDLFDKLTASKRTSAELFEKEAVETAESELAKAQEIYSNLESQFNEYTAKLNNDVNSGLLPAEEAQRMFSEAFDQYGAKVTEIDTAYKDKVKSLDKTIKSKFNRINSEIEKIGKSIDGNKIFESLPVSERQKIEAAYKNAEKRLQAQKNQKKKDEFSEYWFPTFAEMGSGLVSGFNRALAGYGNLMAREGMDSSFSDWLIDRNTTADIYAPAKYEWNKDEWLKRAMVGGSESLGASAPVMVPAAATTLATGGFGAPAWVGVLANAGVSFMGENASIAGENYKRMLEETGDPNKAINYSRKVFQDNLITAPFYLSGGISNYLLLNAKNGLKKKAAGVLFEQIEEMPTETIQSFNEADEETKKKGYFEFMKNNTDLMLDLSVGSLFQSSVMAGVGEAFNALIPEGRAGLSQFMTDMVQNKGVEFADNILKAYLENGTITKEVYDQEVQNLSTINDNLQKLGNLGVSGQVAKLYISLSDNVRQLENEVNNATDESVKAVAEKKLAEAKSELSGVIDGKTPYVVFNVPGGLNSSFAMTVDQFNKLDSDKQNNIVMHSDGSTVVGDADFEKFLAETKSKVGNPKGAVDGMYVNETGEVKTVENPDLEKMTPEQRILTKRAALQQSLDGSAALELGSKPIKAMTRSTDKGERTFGKVLGNLSNTLGGLFKGKEKPKMYLITSQEQAKKVAKAMGQKVDGNYDLNGWYDREMNAVFFVGKDSRAAIHESLMHPVVDAIKALRPDVFNDFARSIADLKVGRTEQQYYMGLPNDKPTADITYGEMTSAMYNDGGKDVVDMETVVQFLSDIANKRITDPTIIQRVQDLIRKLLSKFGIRPETLDLDNTNYEEFAGQLADALAQGREVNITGTPQPNPEPKSVTDFDSPFPDWVVMESRKVSAAPAPDFIASNGAYFENAKKFASNSSFKNKYEFKNALQKIFNNSLKDLRKKYGKNFNPENLDETTKRYLSDVLKQELLNAIAAHPEAIGWYDEKTQDALSVVSLIHPEIETDPAAKGAFILALAITSNGNKVNKNFEYAEQVYRKYKESQRFDDKSEYGSQQIGIKSNFADINSILDTGVSMESLTKFMQSKIPAGRLSYRGSDGKTKAMVTGELATELLYGASIIGPKIGNGFFMNMMGKFDQLTMDRWFMRTWGRLTGTLIQKDPKKIADGRERVTQAIEDVKKNKEAFGILKDILKGKPIEKSAIGIAKQIEKVSTKKELRDKLSANKKLNELRLASNNFAKAVTGEKEAPGNGVERRFIRDVFKDVQDRLKNEEGIEIEMADLQAVIWYPEKILYESFKEGESFDDASEDYDEDGAPDYFNAAKKLAENLGYTKEQIDGKVKERRISRGNDRAKSPAGTGRGGNPVAFSDDQRRDLQETLRSIRRSQGGEADLVKNKGKKNEESVDTFVSQSRKIAKDVVSANVSMAPMYTLKADNYAHAQAIHQTEFYKKYRKQNEDIAQLFGLEVVDQQDTFGAYKGISEASTNIVVKGSFEAIREYSAVISALAPEIQDAVIPSTYVSRNDPNHSADSYEAFVQDAQAAVEALKATGFDKDGYTINNGKVVIYDIFFGEKPKEIDSPNPLVDEKIANFVEDYENRTGTKPAFERRAVRSEYIGAETRTQILGRDPEFAVPGGQGGAIIRDVWQRAKQRSEAFLRWKQTVKTEDQNGNEQPSQLVVDYRRLNQKKFDAASGGAPFTDKDASDLKKLEVTLSEAIRPMFEADQDAFRQSKEEIDSIGADLASIVIGGFNAEYKTKKPARAAIKTVRWYDSQPNRLGDGSRTTVIANTDQDAQRVFDEIQIRFPNTIGRTENNTTELGYPKRLTEIRTSNGKISEIQVMTPAGYLAKEGVKKFPSDQVASANEILNEIRERVGFSIPDGIGHYFYELHRDPNVPAAIRQKAQKLSNDYYDAFLNPQSKIDGQSFGEELLDLKTMVDRADKSRWDAGNTAESPKSMNSFLGVSQSRSLKGLESASDKDLMSIGGPKGLASTPFNKYWGLTIGEENRLLKNNIEYRNLYSKREDDSLNDSEEKRINEIYRQETRSEAIRKISEAYIKAKQDGTNPNLVSAVESLLGVSQSRSFNETVAQAGYTTSQVEEWRKNNKVNQKQKRVPEVQIAAERYRKGEISYPEFNEIVNKYQGIVPIVRVPEIPSFLEIISSLDKTKVEKGIVGLTLQLEDGQRVATRLDIPAYEDFDTWVVSVHDGNSEGKSIGYGQTAVLKNVEFKTNPKVALNIASAKTNARGEVTPKSTIARMFGSWVNENPQSVKSRAEVSMNDPSYIQVGMNPFRHSFFYDKKNGQPIVGADEVIQVGALVLAKNPVMGNINDPQFQTTNEMGEVISFSRRLNQTADKALGRDDSPFELTKEDYDRDSKQNRYQTDAQQLSKTQADYENMSVSDLQNELDRMGTGQIYNFFLNNSGNDNFSALALIELFKRYEEKGQKATNPQDREDAKRESINLFDKIKTITSGAAQLLRQTRELYNQMAESSPDSSINTTRTRVAVKSIVMAEINRLNVILTNDQKIELDNLITDYANAARDEVKAKKAYMNTGLQKDNDKLAKASDRAEQAYNKVNRWMADNLPRTFADAWSDAIKGGLLTLKSIAVNIGGNLVNLLNRFSIEDNFVPAIRSTLNLAGFKLAGPTLKTSLASGAYALANMKQNIGPNLKAMFMGGNTRPEDIRKYQVRQIIKPWLRLQQIYKTAINSYDRYKKKDERFKSGALPKTYRLAGGLSVDANTSVDTIAAAIVDGTLGWVPAFNFHMLQSTDKPFREPLRIAEATVILSEKMNWEMPTLKQVTEFMNGTAQDENMRATQEDLKKIEAAAEKFLYSNEKSAQARLASMGPKAWNLLAEAVEGNSDDQGTKEAAVRKTLGAPFRIFATVTQPYSTVPANVMAHFMQLVAPIVPFAQSMVKYGRGDYRTGDKYFGRAMLGMTLWGLSSALVSAGLITSGDDEDNPEDRSLKNMVGGAKRINVSALSRLLSSITSGQPADTEYKKGDRTVPLYIFGVPGMVVDVAARFRQDLRNLDMWTGDYADSVMNDQWPTALGVYGSSSLKTALEMSFLTGHYELLNAFMDHSAPTTKDYLKNASTRVGSGLAETLTVPLSPYPFLNGNMFGDIFRAMASESDRPYIMNPKANNFMDMYWERMATRNPYPVLNKFLEMDTESELLPKLDFWGVPVKATVKQALSPLRDITIEDDVALKLYKWMESSGQKNPVKFPQKRMKISFDDMPPPVVVDENGEIIEQEVNQEELSIEAQAIEDAKKFDYELQEVDYALLLSISGTVRKHLINDTLHSEDFVDPETTDDERFKMLQDANKTANDQAKRTFVQYWQDMVEDGMIKVDVVNKRYSYTKDENKKFTAQKIAGLLEYYDTNDEVAPPKWPADKRP